MVDENSVVYLYGYSTRKSFLLDNLKKIINIQLDDDARISIVLIHDGVIGTSKKSIIPSALVELLNLPITFYALIPDLEARGIDSHDLRDNITGIRYEELVDILVSIPKILSWM